MVSGLWPATCQGCRHVSKELASFRSHKSGLVSTRWTWWPKPSTRSLEMMTLTTLTGLVSYLRRQQNLTTCPKFEPWLSTKMTKWLAEHRVPVIDYLVEKPTVYSREAVVGIVPWFVCYCAGKDLPEAAGIDNLAASAGSWVQHFVQQTVRALPCSWTFFGWGERSNGSGWWLWVRRWVQHYVCWCEGLHCGPWNLCHWRPCRTWEKMTRIWAGVSHGCLLVFRELSPHKIPETGHQMLTLLWLFHTCWSRFVHLHSVSISAVTGCNFIMQAGPHVISRASRRITEFCCRRVEMKRCSERAWIDTMMCIHHSNKGGGWHTVILLLCEDSVAVLPRCSRTLPG